MDVGFFRLCSTSRCDDGKQAACEILRGSHNTTYQKKRARV